MWFLPIAVFHTRSWACKLTGRCTNALVYKIENNNWSCVPMGVESKTPG